MKRSRADRRWDALARQHDMVVQEYTDRAAGRLPAWTYAPVADFVPADGRGYCPGEHRADEPCEGE